MKTTHLISALAVACVLSVSVHAQTLSAVVHPIPEAPMLTQEAQAVHGLRSGRFRAAHGEGAVAHRFLPSRRSARQG